MSLFVFVGLLFGSTEGPERILAVWHELLPHRRDAPSAKEQVELLLRVALPIGGDLDEFKRHVPKIFPEIFYSLRPFAPFSVIL
jgi:hypothetical protein